MFFARGIGQIRGVMRPPLILTVLLGAVACGGPEAPGDGDAQDVAARHIYTLDNAPFPGSPTALIHLAKGFRADGPLNLVVHYHGWANCIQNVGERTNRACSGGGPRRIAHNLISQIDASGVDAALILVERARDQNSSADGRLAEPGFFRDMILELLPHVGELAGRTYDESDLSSIVLSSHSGGYRALAHSLDRGGLTDHVVQVILLDSVYDNVAQFEAWAQDALGLARLAVVYTDNAGTLALSQQMASDARGWLQQAGLSASLLLDDRTFATQPDSAFDAPLVFKRSALSHDGTAQAYFGKLLAHALH
jgi:hypothetical protein